MGFPNHGMNSYPQGQPVLSAGSATTLAALCHASSLLGISLVPIVGFLLGPLIVWLTQKGNSPFVDHHGREALNFQLNMFLWYIISGIMCLVLVGFFMLAFVALYSVIMTVVATIKAAAGENYRYPLIIRFI